MQGGGTQQQRRSWRHAEVVERRVAKEVVKEEHGSARRNDGGNHQGWMANRSRKRNTEGSCRSGSWMHAGGLAWMAKRSRPNKRNTEARLRLLVPLPPTIAPITTSQQRPSKRENVGAVKEKNVCAGQLQSRGSDLRDELRLRGGIHRGGPELLRGAGGVLHHPTEALDKFTQNPNKFRFRLGEARPRGRRRPARLLPLHGALEDPDKEAAAARVEKAGGSPLLLATEVMAKHDEKYMPAEVAKAIDANKKKIAAASACRGPG
ncbi:hypothetical protein Scep_029447 [Stephania cephalantha]|uniref:Uncharacterized protein n=1 Tax=Stephania cephalantha TaxID=152367 RepID=A0AAP0DXQ9_9MAGN